MSVDRPQGLIEGSGRLGEPRRLDQMVSARLDPRLVAALRHYAEQRGISLSDVLREAAVELLAQQEAQNVITFCVEVTNETRPGPSPTRSFRTAIPAAV
jgi:Ribbon-helix-helix protein, copG family